jgi:hypothetical protein
MAQLDFESEMTAHWMQMGIGPRQAVAKLQPACVGVEPLSEEAIRELEAKWQQGRSAFDIVLDILGGLWNRLAGFDCEDVGWPADHTHVVCYLAETTGDRFAVDDVAQTEEPNDQLTMSFQHQGERHSFTFEHNGTWLNLTGLLIGLNRILEQVGIKERFFVLYMDNGQVSVVVFVLPDKFLPAARELRLRLEEDSGGK